MFLTLYHFFLSHRWTLFDKLLTKAIFDVMKLFNVGADGRYGKARKANSTPTWPDSITNTMSLFVWGSAVDVFLDSRRLQEGMHFLDKFSIALINSVGKPDSPSALLHVVMCQFPFAIYC